MIHATTLELVTFKPMAGTSDEKLRSAAHAVTPVLESYPGFIRRTLAQADDGTWIDSVYWRDRKSAEQAAEAIMHVPVAQAFFALIDQQTMVFRHAGIAPPNETGRAPA